MKTSSRTLLLPVLAFFFSCAMLLPASAQENQPHMKAAVELLHRAQDDHEPLPLLRAAKKELEEAEHDKAGFRVEAIRIIDRAIVEGEAGRPVKMEEHVAAAIKAIRDGIAAGR